MEDEEIEKFMEAMKKFGISFYQYQKNYIEFLLKLYKESDNNET